MGSLSGSCVLNDEVINLPNAYDDARFDRRFDKQTGYTTRSMLMVPITSEQTQDVLGCLQCLNKQTVDGVEEGVVFEQSSDFDEFTRLLSTWKSTLCKFRAPRS